ncbi:MAG: DNA repair protein RecN [Desulfopila sp.]|jgi:DNA repair protein RecN (Recombination protein N)|nr:DNA repair protein RecN [Desulfopila sp.]
MLCELKIENLALIEALHLVFDTDEASSLVVMTGETGAGKSIMLRAIKMLTGGRAQADWVRSGAEQCTVEAVFEVPPEHGEFLQKLIDGGFGDDTTVIIKRVISEKGKSRLYINGSPATVKTVGELSTGLLNVASQHDHQQLLQPQLHLDFVDTLGDLWQERGELAALYRVYKKRCAELAGLRTKEQDKEQKRDFLRFQLDEIRQAELQIGEDEELTAEKVRLKNGDSLIKLSLESYTSLAHTVADELGAVRKNMEQIAELDPLAVPLAEEISGYSFQVEELANQLRRYRDSLDSDPYRLEQVTERIDIVQGLKRKYGSTIAAVLEFADHAEEELARLDSLEIQLGELESEVERLSAELIKAAKNLSARRKDAADHIEKAMEKELRSLAFNRASIEVRRQEIAQTVDDIGPSGWDRIELYFSANPGEPARPLAKVASGGELSRLMLAFKCLLARKDMVETVIFDEVDAGIGGEAAEAVARKIQELAGHHQVFCITHLPQIAARGTDHYRVHKQVNGGRTLSSITKLSQEEREGEVARMLAGESATDQTHAWARELLSKSRGEWISR